MQTYSESDFADGPSGHGEVFHESDFKQESVPAAVETSGPTPNQNYGITPAGSTPYQSAGFGLDLSQAPAGYTDAPPGLVKPLLTNEPVGPVGALIRAVPQTVGGILGGAAGGIMTANPLGAWAGSGAGATLGEGARQAAVGAFSGRTGTQAPSFQDAAGESLKAGAMQAAMEGLGTVWKLGTQMAPTVGAGAMRAMAGIPERSAMAALDDLGLLRRAASDADVSAAYDAFYKASGTVSRRQYVAGLTDPVDTAERAMADMKAVWAKGQSGQQLSNQELVNASQGARVIRDAKATGSEFARQVSDSADSMKSIFDQIIESRHPSYQPARQAAWENSVAADFKPGFPVNKNGSTNQLRAYTGIKAGLAGAATGAAGAAAAVATNHPGYAALAGLGAITSLLSPLAESPAVYGAAIKAADVSAPLIKAAASGIRFAPGSIEAYYRALGSSAPSQQLSSQGLQR